MWCNFPDNSRLRWRGTLISVFGQITAFVTSHHTPQHLILMTPATNSTSTREISQKHPTLSSCTGEEENTWALHCLLADYRTSVSWQKIVDLKIKLCKGLMSALKYQKQGQLLPETASLFTHKTPHKKYRNCGRTDENVKKKLYVDFFLNLSMHPQISGGMDFSDEALIFIIKFRQFNKAVVHYETSRPTVISTKAIV